MRRMMTLFFLSAVLTFSAFPVNVRADGAVIRAFDRNGAEISGLVDGNNLKLSIKLSAPVAADSEAFFLLNGLQAPVAACLLRAGTDTCTSPVFSALGWYWGVDGAPNPERVLGARVASQDMLDLLTLRVHPRPVVMVHGFMSNWETWQAYLGPAGYLASMGLQGFAVGDGQEPGVLDTGNPSNPSGHTNSIAQNAEILGQYISAVQKRTGAEKVDLLAHSMGGMISRYYLDRVMMGDEVAQVIFLGSPMAGSACTYPLASLGYLTPASQEILPYYMVNIFNQQILRRHGVPFHMVAGTLLTDPLTSPCTDAPSDSVVGLDSATSITMDDVQELSMFHGDFTSSKKVFEQNVRHLLQSPPGSFAPRADLLAPSVSTQTEQFSRVYSGHIRPGESAQVTIDIDPNVSLANFSLYDSTRSLVVEVHGASGNLIALDATKNGLIKIDDPATMLYLGYGFKQPKPGKWVITLKTTPETPAQGLDYALTARFIGGSILSVSSSVTILDIGQPVKILARLETHGSSLTVETAQALIRKPDGAREILVLSLQGDDYFAEYRPQQSGLHSVEVSLSAKNADGFGVDRAAFLAFEVQPGGKEVQNSRILVTVIACMVLLLIILLVWFLRNRRKTRRI